MLSNNNSVLSYLPCKEESNSIKSKEEYEKCNNLEKAVEIAWKEGLVNNSSWTIVVKEGIYNIDQDLLNQITFNSNNNH